MKKTQKEKVDNIFLIVYMTKDIMCQQG